MKLKLWQIDAFANKPLEGNPAAVVPLEAWIDAGLMQKIATENNLSETAFFVKSGPGRYDLRWFTPAAEVELCGHATLASAWLVFETLDRELNFVSFQTRSASRRLRRFSRAAICSRYGTMRPSFAESRIPTWRGCCAA